jgi:hypothetical protein
MEFCLLVGLITNDTYWYPHFIVFQWLDIPSRPRPLYCRGFTITPRRTTLRRSPLDEGSARIRDLYLQYTTNKRHAPGFEPATPAGERPQTHVLDRGATGIDMLYTAVAKPRMKWIKSE